MLGKEVHILGRNKLRQAVRSGYQIEKSPFFGFFYPFFGVTVAVEDDFFMVQDCFFQQFVDSLFHLFRPGVF